MVEQSRRLKVSILVPVYNGANFLAEAIDSALCQTTEASIEIIVVNDGSDDRGQTAAIARSFGSRIRYYEKANGGVSSALNFGIKRMTGQWFIWLSHDDLLSDNRVSEDIRRIQSNPAIRVLFCKLAIIDEKGRLSEECKYPIKHITNPREALMLGGVDMGTMTIHRSCFNRVGGFIESNYTTQDVMMTLSLSQHYPFYFNDRATKYTREHPRRGTHTMKEQVKKDCLLLAEFMHKQFTFSDFFPNKAKMTEKEIASGWNWLGRLYRYFGSDVYASECFQNESNAL
jgi:glycosyltransferase involved in cell wall biosynthesis